MRYSIKLISKERDRQIKKEGFDKKNDDAFKHGVLSNAAVCYAFDPQGGDATDFIRRTWPFAPSDFKCSCIGNTEDDIKGRIKDLVKAGALIAAEIDRLKRKL